MTAIHLNKHYTHFLTEICLITDYEYAARACPVRRCGLVCRCVGEVGPADICRGRQAPLPCRSQWGVLREVPQHDAALCPVVDVWDVGCGMHEPEQRVGAEPDPEADRLRPRAVRGKAVRTVTGTGRSGLDVAAARSVRMISLNGTRRGLATPRTRCGGGCSTVATTQRAMSSACTAYW